MKNIRFMIIFVVIRFLDLYTTNKIISAYEGDIMLEANPVMRALMNFGFTNALFINVLVSTAVAILITRLDKKSLLYTAIGIFMLINAVVVASNFRCLFLI